MPKRSGPRSPQHVDPRWPAFELPPAVGRDQRPPIDVDEGGRRQETRVALERLRHLAKPLRAMITRPGAPPERGECGERQGRRQPPPPARTGVEREGEVRRARAGRTESDVP